MYIMNKTHYNQLRNIFMKENKINSYEVDYWEEDIKSFHYLVVDNENSNRYIAGNLLFILLFIDEFLQERNNFKYSLNSFDGFYERFIFINNNNNKFIKIYDMEKIFDLMKNTEKEIPKIFIKNSLIDLNKTDREYLKTFIKNKYQFSRIISNKKQIESNFINISLLTDKKEIIKSSLKPLRNTFDYNIKNNIISSC